MNLPSNLPVVQSPGARAVFLLSAIVTVAIVFWSHRMGLSGSTDGLTPIFFVLFTYFDYPAASVGLVILLLAALIPNLSVRPLLKWIGVHSLFVAGAVLIVLCVGALLVYQNHPLAMDEYAPLFQSQIFASGHLAGQFPAPLLDWLVPRGFQNYFINVSPVTGHVASTYWPSFALLLTPFTLLGIPWACNPVISALTVLAINRLALKLFDSEESAGLAVLLTVASPVFFANGISYYSMPAHLLANTIYCLLLVTPTVRSAMLAGIAGSIALTLHNPVPHMLFALPWFVWVGSRERGMRTLLWLCIGYLPLCLLLGIGWFWYSAQLMHEGLVGVGGPGAAEFQHLGTAFSIPTSTILFARLVGFAKIWVWSVPGLIIVACLGVRRWRGDRRSWLFVASGTLTLLGYLFVPVDQGHGWGFRYFHSAWLALPLLAAATLPHAEPSRQAASGSSTDGLHAYLMACAFLSLVLGVGLRAKQIHEFITDDLSQLPHYGGTERQVEFIYTNGSFYGADLVQNDPWLRGNVIRMISNGPAADEAMMHRNFPTLHPVFADDGGVVWSTAASQIVHRPRGPRPPPAPPK